VFQRSGFFFDLLFKEAFQLKQIQFSLFKIFLSNFRNSIKIGHLLSLILIVVAHFLIKNVQLIILLMLGSFIL